MLRQIAESIIVILAIIKVFSSSIKGISRRSLLVYRNSYRDYAQELVTRTKYLLWLAYSTGLSSPDSS